MPLPQEVLLGTRGFGTSRRPLPCWSQLPVHRQETVLGIPPSALRWVARRVQSSQQCPVHPPGRLPQSCQVMYGPLALPGSSRWMGSTEGWAQSQKPGTGRGRCLALEKAIPGRPPSLTEGRTGSTGVVSGMAPTRWPVVCGSTRSWRALAPHGISPGFSFLICKMAIKHPLGGGRKDQLRECPPSTAPDSGCSNHQRCEA